MSLQIAILAVQLGLILFAARIFGNLAQKLKVPSVLGELLAGIVIGPYLLGALKIPLHGFENGIFPLIAGSALPVSVPLYALATLGSIILLFVSGLETDLRMFFRYSVTGTVVGLGGVIFSFAFGDVLGMIMYKTSFMDPRALFLGILCTATSVGITARILSEKKSIDSPEGTTILAAAVIDDVLGIICLAVVMGIVGASGGSAGAVKWSSIGMIALKSVGIWLGVTALGLLCAHKIAKLLKLFPPSGTFSILAFGLALLLAGMFEQAGLAMIVGAYVMGLSLSKTDIAFSVKRHLDGIYGLLVPVFFVVMGMLVDISVFRNPFVVKWGLIYAALAILAKIIGCAVPAFFMNFNFLGSLRIGMGMIPRGEVALIIAGIGSTTMMKTAGGEVPVIGAELFGIVIIMTLLTTVAAPPLLAAILGINGKGVRKERRGAVSAHTVYTVKSEVIREFIMRIMLENLSRDGFRFSEFDRGGGVTHFRRDNTTFTLTVNGGIFDFESKPDEVPLIKTVMYETFALIHQEITELKDFAGPDKIDEAVITPQDTPPPPPKKPVKSPIRIDKVLSKEAIFTDIEAEDQTGAIKELIRRLNETGVIKDAGQCESDALEREALMSTCIPGGVSLPHARTEGVEKLTAAIGISRKGCKPSGGQQEPTHIFVLSLCPKSAHQPYLQFIAHVAGILAKPENVNCLVNSDSADEIFNVFLGGRKQPEKH